MSTIRNMSSMASDHETAPNLINLKSVNQNAENNEIDQKNAGRENRCWNSIVSSEETMLELNNDRPHCVGKSKNKRFVSKFLEK